MTGHTPTSWLLETSNPSVRFWALQDIEDLPRTHPDVQTAQNDLMESPPVKTILDAQSSGGYWVGEGDMYNPKYTATTHSLLVLAELGAKRSQAVERGMEQIFRFQRDSGHFLTQLPVTEKGRASTVKDGCCLDGNILHYSLHFGYLDDPRIKRLIDFILDYHDREKAGWRCRSYPINASGVSPVNCYMGAVKVLRALSTIPPTRRSNELEELIEREVENVLENYVYRYLRNPDGSRKEKAGWKRFGFPLFYQSDVLEVIDTLARLGVNDERIKPAIDLILDARQPDGTWLMENTFNGKMWIDIEAKGRPSKWITLRATRALRRLCV